MKNIYIILAMLLSIHMSHAQQWDQLGLDINGEAESDYSGIAISLSTDGSTLAIGATFNDGNGSNSGHVRVYSWNGTAWVQLGSDIDGENFSDYSGTSVSLSSDGSILAIGAVGNRQNGSTTGHVRVYTWNGTSWTQMGTDIDGDSANDRFGQSVSLSSDGNTLAVGAHASGGTAGYVRVYSWSVTSWNQMGSDIDGEATGDRAGYSISLSSDGSILAIGAPINSGNGIGSGHVRVYSWSGTAWNQMGVDIDGEYEEDGSGWTVSLSSDGSILAIGARTNDGNGSASGHVRVYSWSGAAWVQLGSDIDGEAANDYSGYSVSLSSDGNRLAIGAYGNDENGNESGHVRVYSWSGTAWDQLGSDIDGEAAGDNSGISVSLSSDGSKLAIGARYAFGSAYDSGDVRVFKFSPSESTFTGTGNWSESARWSDGVPGSTTNVTINGYCTVTAAASCNNLTIKDGGSLMGQGNLTLSGSATVERYISGYAGGDAGWHFISSPITDLNIASSDFLPGSGVDDLYEWDEASGMWLNYYDTFDDVTFDEGKGYLIAYSSDGTKSFSGIINASTEIESLSYNAGAGDGWNLLGNPFPSAIDATAITFTGSVNTGIYIVDPSNGSYMAHNGVFGHPALADGHIPINQGFFVQATGAGASVTMETADQVHSTNAFNKKSQTMPDESLMVTLSGENSDSYTFIGLRDDASMSFDGNYDAYELFGWATMAQVYTEIDDVKYSINCLPHSEQAITVPMGIYLQSDEELSLNFSGIDTFDSSIRIDLEDKQLGHTQNIKENPVYSFQSSTQDDTKRFLLHFNGVTTVDELGNDNNIQIYAIEDGIYINHPHEIDAQIYIYNINGQLVEQAQMRYERTKRISINRNARVYIVRIENENTVYTEKILINIK